MRCAVFFVGSCLLSFSVAPAASLPAPAVLIDSGLDFVRSERNQSYASAAYDGTNWLVVWQDERGDREAVWGARVNSAGAPLDPGNICIADDEDSRYEPRVAFNGTNYLVVWQDGRNSTSDIYGARVTSGGAVLDSNGFPVSQSAEDQKYPTVASSGSDFLVVWEDTRTSGNDEDVYAARVTGSGVVLDTGGIAVSTALMPQENLSVASYGSGYLVAWRDRRNDSLTSDDIYAARVTTSGNVMDPSGIAVAQEPEGQDYPMLASDGTNCLIVWNDERNGSGDVYGARVSSTGAVLDPSGIPIHAPRDYWAGDPCVAYTGSNYLVVWEDDSTTMGMYCNILAARVTTGGQVLDPEGTAVSHADYDQYWPVVAAGSSNLLVAWQGYPTNDDPDIYAKRVTTAGTPLDTADVPLSRVLYAYEQLTPAAAFDGTNFMTAWCDQRTPTNYQHIYGARISQAGSLLDPGGFLIRTDDNPAGAPAVAFGDSNYLVAWYFYSGSMYRVEAARVTPSGILLDSNPIYPSIAGSGGTAPAVAFDGTNWLIVAAYEDYGHQSNVQARRIARDGTVVDSQGIRLAYIPDGLDEAAVAFGATSYLVVWQDFRSGTTYDIYGARVGTDGMILDSSGIAISTAAGSQYSPSVAFDGTNWLVAWRDNSSETYYFTRVSQSGSVLDPSGIRLGWCPDNYNDAAQLAFDGTNYFAVWQWRNYSNGDLWGARISPTGTVLDTFPVSTAPEYQATPAIAVGTGGNIFIAYSGYVETLHGYTTEMMRTWAGIYPFYGIEEAPTATVRTPKDWPTIVRGVLLLSASPCPRVTASPCLLDVSGRKIMELRPGANDVSILAPGVYFVRATAGRGPSAATKIVIQK